MRISALEEYGLRCALDLARHQKVGLVSASKLAEREGISPEYASKILFLLRSSGLVRSERGNQGGFQLIESPETLTVKRVFDAVEPKAMTDDQFCAQFAGQLDQCVHLGTCSIKPVWTKLSLRFDEVLEQLTLADLMGPASNRNFSPLNTLGSSSLKTVESKTHEPAPVSN